MTVLRSGSATDVGRVRTSNQDLALEEPNLFAVADGMGGHVGGEVAARVAVDALRSAFARQPSVDGLREAVAEANAAVWRQGQARSDLRGMGTTMTAVALVAGPDGRDMIALANVGDSRAYVFSGGRAVQVTSDHSLAEEKVRQGELTEAEAAVHPHRHILTRALGVSSDVDIDLWELHLHDGDRILLCSDGLTNEVGTDQIAAALGTVPDPSEAAQSLVAAALQHGGNDNVTVLVVDVLVGDQQPEGAEPSGLAPAAGVAGAVVATGAAGTAGAVDLAAGQSAGSGVAPPATPTGDSLTGVVPAQPQAPGSPGSATTPASVAPDGAPMVAAPGVGPEVPGGGAGGPGPAADEPTRRERRRQRRRERRAAGVPRRLTFRVGLFVILLLVVVAAAYTFLRWYATDNWYVTIEGKHLVIYQGRSGGLLWFKPKLVERTSVTTGEVLSTHLTTLAADVNEPSLADAQHYVANLHQEYVTQRRIERGQVTGTTTTATFPSTTTTTVAGGVTTTTAPGSVATTSPTTTTVP